MYRLWELAAWVGPICRKTQNTQNTQNRGIGAHVASIPMGDNALEAGLREEVVASANQPIEAGGIDAQLLQKCGAVVARELRELGFDLG